jgi:hypothetical protein
MFNSSTRFVIDGKTVMLASMPKIYRIVDLKRVVISDTLICCTATLYHRHLSPRVAWTCRTVDQQIKKLALVSIRWNCQPVCEDGVLHIARLLSLDLPDESINLFDTVPPVLIPDQALADRGRVLLNQLPRRFKRLLNAIFWDPQRLLWFVAGPASLTGHHARINGNLRHAIEVAETALRIAHGRNEVFRAMIILGSLLRDAGKAELYRLDPVEARFIATNDGELGAQRRTVIEWLMVAISRFGIDMPKTQRDAILQILSDAAGIVKSLERGEPRSPEAFIISMAEHWIQQAAKENFDVALADKRRGIRRDDNLGSLGEPFTSGPQLSQ